MTSGEESSLNLVAYLVGHWSLWCPWLRAISCCRFVTALCAHGGLHEMSDAVLLMPVLRELQYLLVMQKFIKKCFHFLMGLNVTMG